MGVPNAAYTDRYELFREILKELRESKGVTQAQLAERLEIPQSYVSKYETGERRLDFVETAEICEALGIKSLKKQFKFALVNTLTNAHIELDLAEMFGRAKGIYPTWSILL